MKELITIEYKQWFSCEGCRSLKGNKDGVYCRLAFKMDKEKTAPLEPCPKPATMERNLVCELMGYHKWDRLQEERNEQAKIAVAALERALKQADKILE